MTSVSELKPFGVACMGRGTGKGSSKGPAGAWWVLAAVLPIAAPSLSVPVAPYRCILLDDPGVYTALGYGRVRCRI